MKSFVAILALVAVVAADVSHLSNDDSAAQIVEQNADVFPDQYQFNFKTSNGIAAQEQGIIKNPGSENEALEVQGSNSYIGPDGQTYSVNYVSNENGYQPQGSHLPVAPEIPEYIIRSLEFIRTHAPKEVARN